MSNQSAFLDAFQKPMRVGSSEIPEPGPGQVVVKNHAVAINPVDWKIQSYSLFIKTFPNVLGTDVAGEVHAVGPDVTKVKKGDRVIAHCLSLATQKPEDGGFQKYSRAPAYCTAKIPDSLSFTQASVLPLAIDTAVHGLCDSTEKNLLGLSYPSLNPKPSGKTILIWGGSSSVGATTIQIAVATGAKVVSVASKHNLPLLKSLGVTEALDYNTPTIVEDVVKAIRSAGGEFAGIYDAITSEASFKHVFPIAEQMGGCNVAMVMPPPEKLPAHVKAGAVFAVNEEVCAPVWRDYVTPALEQGKLKAVPEAMVIGKGLEHVQKAVDTNKAGVSGKKVVVEL